MAKSKLKAQVDDELRTRFVCPDVLLEQQEGFLSGTGEQLLSKLTDISFQQAGQVFEMQQHRLNPEVFVPRLPRVSGKRLTEAQLHALLASSFSKQPGFEQLLPLSRLPSTHSPPADDGSGSQAVATPTEQQKESPLLRLLRRVSLWWYYRVMFDPLEQLVALSSSYELLFQLMTPHQQLSCMGDILLVLACPFLDGQIGQLDTPLHTATLLSMLKMAQQLAAAEAELQEQSDLLEALNLQLDKEGSDAQRAAEIRAAAEAHQEQGVQAAALILSPPAALLRISRAVYSGALDKKNAAVGAVGEVLDGVHGSPLQQLFAETRKKAAAQRSGGFEMATTNAGLVTIHRSALARDVGAFLGQLAQLPEQQLQHWWATHTQADEEGFGIDAAAAAAAAWVSMCCPALKASGGRFELHSKQGDPLHQLLQWVLRVLQPQQASRQHHDQQQQQQQQEQGLQEQHPAEGLLQVLEVVFSALQHRHMLNTHEWKLAADNRQGQRVLLAALHCHCTQVLAAAREQLPASACGVGGCSSAPADAAAEAVQQQQREAWQQCLVQVQHDLLLVMQLSKHWQAENGRAGFEETVDAYIRHGQAFLPDFLMAAPKFVQEQPTAAAAAGARAAHLQLEGLSGVQEHFWPVILPQLPGMQDAGVVAARVVAKVAAAAAADAEPAFSNMRRGFLDFSAFSRRAKQQQQGGAATPGARGASSSGSSSQQDLQAAVQRVAAVVDDLQHLQKGGAGLRGMFPGAAANSAWSQRAAQYGCSDEQLQTAASLLCAGYYILGAEDSVLPAAGPPQPPEDAVVVAVMRRILEEAAAPKHLITLLEAAVQRCTQENLFQLLPLFQRAAGQGSSTPQPQHWNWVAGSGAPRNWASDPGAGAGFEDELGELVDPTGFDVAFEGFGEDPMDWQPEVLRLRGGGRGGSSIATSQAEGSCAEDHEQQLPPSPLRQQQHRQQQQPWVADSRLLARLQQRRQQQQLRPIAVVDDDDSGTDTLSPAGPAAYLSPTAAAAAEAADAASEGGSDVFSSDSGGDTDVLVAVPAAGRRGRAQDHRGAHQRVNRSLQLQQQGADAEEEEEGQSVLGSSSTAAFEAAAATQVPGLDVFASAAAASSSRHRLPAYSWQEEEQQDFDSEQLLRFDQRQGRLTVGYAGGLGGADADAADASEHQEEFGSSSEGAAATWEGHVAAAAVQQGHAGSWPEEEPQEQQQWQELPGAREPALGWRRRSQNLSNPGAAAAHAEDAGVDAGAELGSDSGSDGSSGSSERSYFSSDQQGLLDSIIQGAALPDVADADTTAAERPAAAAAAGSSQGRLGRLMGRTTDMLQQWQQWQEVLQGADRQQGLGESCSSDSSFSSGEVGVFTPDFSAAFERCYADWELVIQQGGLLRQQQQLPHEPPLQQQQPLAAAEVQAFQPSRRQEYFAAAGDGALHAWIGLLVAAASGSKTVRSHVAKLLDTLEQLSFFPDLGVGLSTCPGYQASGTDVAKALQKPEVLALLTLALQADVSVGFELEEDQRVAVTLSEQLWAAMDSAYCTVIFEVSKAPKDLQKLASVVYEDILQRLETVTQERVQELQQQGFAAVVPAVTHWVQLLCQQLEALGPVPVAAFDSDTVVDDLVTKNASEVPHAKAILLLWAEQFSLAMEVIKDLVQVDAWLGHVGRNLQASHKLMRRTQRVLAAEHGDAVLAGLQELVVQSQPQQLSDALVAACQAHKHVQDAFTTSIARDGYGVIQRAFQLMCQLHREMKTQPAYSDPHHELVERLCGLVMVPITQYLPSASAFLPQVHLTPEEAYSICKTWSDANWQQVISLFAAAKPACTVFWWMAAPQAVDTISLIEKRADGILLVCKTQPPQCSASAASMRPAGARNGTAAAPRLGSRQRQRASDGVSSGDSSSGTGWGAPPPGLQQSDPALFSAAHQHNSSLDPTYDICDDTAVDVDSVCLHEKLQQLQLQQQELQQLQLQQSQQQDAKFLELHRQRQLNARSTLFRRMQGPLLPPDVEDSLFFGYMPPGSASSSSCSEVEGEGVGEQQHWDGSNPTGELSTQAAQGIAGGFRTVQQQQARQEERQLRRVRHIAAMYGWDFRPWHVQRAVLLSRRQAILNRVTLLQNAAAARRTTAQALSEQLGLSTAELPATAAGVFDAWAAVLPRAEASAAAPAASSRADGGSSSSTGQALLVRLQHSAAADALAGPPLPPAVTLLLRHVGCTGMSLPAVDQARRLQDVAERLAEQQQRLGAVLGQAEQHQLGHSTAKIVQEHAEVQQKAGNTTRQLLWEVLKQLKPAACEWYEAGAQHHLQQQQDKINHMAGVSMPAPRSAEGGSVTKCTSLALWSTLTHSLASGLLLVPPSIRDLVGNGWAAGAGRLGAGGDGSNSRVAGVAARMLAVQYARAARRHFVQGYQTSVLVSQLLSLQLLAEDADKLAELQPRSVPQVEAALAAHTAAAAAGLLPLTVLAAEHLGMPLGASTPSSSYCAASGGGSSAAADGSGSNGGSCGSSAAAGPSLLHLYAQAGCFTGSPHSLLPWLQLVSRMNALSADMSPANILRVCRKLCELSDEQHWQAEVTKTAQPWKLIAGAAALSSLGLPVSPFVTALAEVAAGEVDTPLFIQRQPKLLVMSPLTTAVTPVLLESCEVQQLRHLQQQQQQPAEQECAQQQAAQPPSSQQQMCVDSAGDSIRSIAYWLHAERLMQVPPGAWQQHLAQQLLRSRCGSNAGSSGSSGTAGLDLERVRLLADVACDWCSKALPEGPAGGQGAPYGCPSCGAAQYCSRVCAEVAKKVHNANCWRLQVLARNGLCWQQPGYQRSPSSSRSRSFWDLAAVEPH